MSGSSNAFSNSLANWSSWDPVANLGNLLFGQGAGNGASGNGLLGNAASSSGLGLLNTNIGGTASTGVAGNQTAPASESTPLKNSPLFSSGWGQIFANGLIIIVGFIIFSSALKVPSIVTQSISTASKIVK